MKKSMLSLVLMAIMLFAMNTIFAQKGRMKNVMEDVAAEDEGLFTLRFYHALTGDPVEGGTVSIEEVGEYVSDSAGRVRFPAQPDGMFRVIFEKDNYIRSMFKVEVIAETIFKNRLIVSPMMDIDQFRVVLDWDEKPGDLDSHFLKKNGYHISFRNTRVLSDGSGQLDRDDMDGHGPETITVASLDSKAEYTYYVNNYTAKISPAEVPLSRSKATVRVYGNNRLIKTFQVPQNHTGVDWQVFKVVNGQVVDY
jgi:hypothetical protein